MKNLSFYLIISILFCYCEKNKNVQGFQITEKKNDTIFAPSKYITKYKNCIKNIDGYTKKYNIYLSKFYISEKGLLLDNKDSVTIIKPFYTQENTYGNCSSEEPFDNLLLIYNNADDKTTIYKNALYVDNPNIFQEILLNKKGFIISAEKGNSSKIFSRIKILYQNNKPYVDSIQIESWGFNQYKKKYGFKKLKLENYSVSLLDSLENINNK